jgi:hypothetical protein
VPWPTEDPANYFEIRGLSLLVVKDDEHGDYAADILSADLGECVASRYSSGSSESEAVAAVRRWHVEQDPPLPPSRRLP